LISIPSVLRQALTKLVRLINDRKNPYVPRASEDPRVLLPPGGTIRLDDEFYVRRDADAQIDKTARLSGQTLVIKAPRQMGKSSLLIRYLAGCKSAEKRIAFIDFQSFAEADLSEFPVLACRLAQVLRRQFGLRPDSERSLNFPSQLDFTFYLEDKLLPVIGSRITIAMDEVDRLLGRAYQSEFFSMLRHWHNERAQPSSAWESVDLAIAMATEPYLLISQADQSTFNVTPAIELGPFQRLHLDQLNRAFGEPLRDPQLDQLYELLCGHVYLTRLAFYQLMSGREDGFQALMQRASDPDGPFGEHLRSRLFLLQQQPDTLAAMQRVVAKKVELDSDTFYRLHAVGLVERQGKHAVPANLLYARFFKRLV
jgi:hypothetical protein